MWEEIGTMRQRVITAVVLLAAAARARDSTQDKLAHLQNPRDDAVHCLRVALREGNYYARTRLVAECQKAFIKAIDDAQFVFVGEGVGPLLQSALAEAMEKGSER
jgi:hypothetical protein